ncbi:MAG: beta-glucosidase, partial [Sphingobacteriales bacterium]
MRDLRIYAAMCLLFLLFACGKGSTPDPAPPVQPPASTSFSFNALKVNGVFSGFTYTNINNNPVIKLSFATVLDRTSIASAITLKDKAGATVTYTTGYENNDSTVVISPMLNAITRYTLDVTTGLKSTKGGNLQSGLNVIMITAVDPSDKFPVISDNELLDLVQKQTLKYFYDFGHPISGMALER